ncbi:MAG TPA: DNA translocase FtsK 4TM domain-containing protein, partial [Terriglobales bacterium]|nr:DNA translocase FtsK 4TM domain-containing protein [Terriglobales bacterium]
MMLILGIMLLIGLFIPSGGSLTDFIRNIVAPWFGTPRWLLPFVLLLLGYYLYRAQSDNSDWQLTLLGSAVSYLSLLGVVGLVTANDTLPRGGGVGKALADFLSPLVSAPGAGLILSILMVAGLLLALDMSLPSVMAPMGRLVSRAINALFRPAPQEMGAGTPTAALSGPAGSLSASAAGNGATARTEKHGKEGARPAADPRANFGEGISTIPVAIPNPGPLSQTFAPPASASAVSRDGGQLTVDARDGQSIRNGAPVRGQRQPTDAPAQSKLSGLLATAEKPRPEYHLPPRALLEDIAPRGGDSTM